MLRPLRLLSSSQLQKDDTKTLRVRMIQKEGVQDFSPVYLFDEGSNIEWEPCGKKLSCSFPGIKFKYGADTFYGNDVSVVEMDGAFDNLQEVRVYEAVYLQQSLVS